MGRVRFTSRVIPWSVEQEAKFDLDVLDMATDIHRVANILAPFLIGALVSSGRIDRKGLAWYSVIYGGGRVPYARRRHFENKLHPGTLRYLQRAGDSTGRNIKRYIK